MRNEPLDTETLCALASAMSAALEGDVTAVAETIACILCDDDVLGSVDNVRMTDLIRAIDRIQGWE